MSALPPNDTEELPNQSLSCIAPRILSQHFPSVVLARCAWEWAGGRVELFPETGTPLEIWTELWQCSTRGEPGTTSPAALVREALFEAPGNPGLVGLVRRLLGREDEALVERVRCALPGLLSALRGGDAHALCTWLTPFERSHHERLFLALCAGLHGRLDDHDCENAIPTIETMLVNGPEPEREASPGRVLAAMCDAAASQWIHASRVCDGLESFRFELGTIASTHAILFAGDPTEDGYVELDIAALTCGLETIRSWVQTSAPRAGLPRLLLFEELVRTTSLRVAERGASVPWPELGAPLASMLDGLRAIQSRRPEWPPGGVR